MTVRSRKKVVCPNVVTVVSYHSGMYFEVDGPYKSTSKIVARSLP